MLESLIAVFVSLGATLGLVYFFRFERERGMRFCAYGRDNLDYRVLKVTHTTLAFLRGTVRDALRQIARYFFHTILLGILAFLDRLEKRVKHLLRSNRTLAKKSERERATLNKLEEIALHKMEVALTEEEKKRHREKSLHG